MDIFLKLFLRKKNCFNKIGIIVRGIMIWVLFKIIIRKIEFKIFKNSFLILLVKIVRIIFIIVKEIFFFFGF